MKADLKHLESSFSWELGSFFFVDESFRNYGISNMITKLLLNELVNENVMATTELFPDNPMKHILEKYDFRLHGKPWLSIKHNGAIGLFLKFTKGTAKKILL